MFYLEPDFWEATRVTLLKIYFPCLTKDPPPKPWGYTGKRLASISQNN